MKKEEGLSENSLIETEQYELIESKIFMCRDMPVMLDSDVADFFGVEVKRLNQQMNRNKNRFPSDFCFQLNSKEFKNLRSQNATFNTGVKGRKYRPYAYTEQGVIALAGVIKNDFAVEMSIVIVRSFIAMRKFIAANGDVLLKLAQLQNRQLHFEEETNKRFDEVIKMIDKADLPKRMLFFHGEYFDAYDFISSIIRKAKQSIVLIDPYCDSRALTFLSNKNEGVKITICKSSRAKLTQDEIDIFVAQYGEVTVFDDDTVHDRFLVVDETECYSLGASLNYAGKKTFEVYRNESERIISAVLEIAR